MAKRVSLGFSQTIAVSTFDILVLSFLLVGLMYMVLLGSDGAGVFLSDGGHGALFFAVFPVVFHVAVVRFREIGYR